MAEDCIINLAKGNNFSARIVEAPIMSSLITSVILPNLAMGEIQLPNKKFKLSIPGTELDYGQFMVTFNLDEDWKAYTEIYDWLMLMRDPDISVWENKFSDGAIVVYNNQEKPILEIDFIALFPMSLDDIPLATSSAEGIALSVTFAFEKFRVTRLPV